MSPRLRTYLLYAAIVILLLTLATACGSEREAAKDGGENGHSLYVENVMVNGRNVTCVVYDDNAYDQGGVSCDWERHTNR